MNAEEAAQLLALNNGWCVIDIYCGDKSHKGGVYPGLDVASWVLDHRHDPPRWSLYVEKKRGRGAKVQPSVYPPADVRAVLVGNRRINDHIDVDPSIMEQPGVRVRYRLFCNKCRQRRRLGKSVGPLIDETILAERLYPLLDTLVLNAEDDEAVDRPNPGVFRISLANIAAKL